MLGVYLYKKSYSPVGSPNTKYLSGPGWKSFILFATYFAAHSDTAPAESKITSLIFPRPAAEYLNQC